MSLFLCVDCGGSKTAVVICNRNGDVLGRALGGPSNFSYMSSSSFSDVVGAAISDALKTAVSPPSPTPVPLPPKDNKDLFASAWFGISGVDSPGAAHSAEITLSALLNIPIGPRLIVANDTHLLAAPLGLHPDVSLAVTAIAGTGSCVVSFTKDPSGLHTELARTGGLGWILGDEGGGFHVGRETIREMMLDLAHQSLGVTSIPPSTLKTDVLAQFGITGDEKDVSEVLIAVHLPELVGAAAESPAPDTPSYLLVPREKRLSKLSPLVFQAAFERKDAFALRVLRKTAGELADQIALLCFGPGEDVTVKPRGVKAEDAVLCFGGSLVGIADYRELVLDELKKRGCVFRHVEHVSNAAAVGAAGLAAVGIGAKE